MKSNWINNISTKQQNERLISIWVKQTAHWFPMISIIYLDFFAIVVVDLYDYKYQSIHLRFHRVLLVSFLIYTTIVTVTKYTAEKLTQSLLLLFFLLHCSLFPTSFFRFALKYLKNNLLHVLYSDRLTKILAKCFYI